mgnify:CR=1 FL=1
MAYSCSYCNWKWDSYDKDIHLIIEHDKTHSENNIKNIKAEDNGIKPACSFCGCAKEHDKEDIRSSRIGVEDGI